MERRLTAILTTDVVGYSRLVEADEAGTLRRLKTLYDACILPAIAQHGWPADQAYRRWRSRRISERNECGAVRRRGAEAPAGTTSRQRRLNAWCFVSASTSMRAIRVWSWPRPLLSLRAQGKARVFVANFDGNNPQEAAVGVDLADGIKAHFARLTGFETALDPAQAHYRVQGSVRIAAGRARIIASLASAESSRQIWSERYDESTDDPFDIVDRCTPRIATSLRRRIAADDAARLSNRPIDELSFEELLAHAGASFLSGPGPAGAAAARSQSKRWKSSREISWRWRWPRQAADFPTSSTALASRTTTPPSSARGQPLAGRRPRRRAPRPFPVAPGRARLSRRGDAPAPLPRWGCLDLSASGRSAISSFTSFPVPMK